MPLIETDVVPRDIGSGAAENWAVDVARLEPKIAISVPGAMAGSELAALRIPAELVAGPARSDGEGQLRSTWRHRQSP